MKHTWLDLYRMLNSNPMARPFHCPPDKCRTETCGGCMNCWNREIPEGTRVVLEFTEYANGGIKATYVAKE